MDVISHGLWGGLTVGRKSKKSFLLAFLFGVAPDVVSFGIFMISNVLGISSRPDWSSGPPDAASIPGYVYQLYDFTHSFVIFLVVFGIVWLIRKKPFMEMGAWGLHILFDIPTHSLAFFPTPFLWPLAEVHVNGTTWATPWIFFPNWAFLIVLYAFFIIRKVKAKRTSVQDEVKEVV